MKRREFLGNSIATSVVACTSTVLLAGVLESCSGVAYYAATTNTSNSITVPLSEFVDATTNPHGYRPFVMVKHTQLRNPVCVYRNSDTSYVALSTACTHKGCQLRPSAQDLVCPCHGSEFATDGRVLTPPASQNLPQYNVSLSADALTITL